MKKLAALILAIALVATIIVSSLGGSASKVSSIAQHNEATAAAIASVLE